MSLDWEAAWHDAQERLERSEAVRRQLAEALRLAASSLSDEWEDMRHAALAASDALDSGQHGPGLSTPDGGQT